MPPDAFCSSSEGAPEGAVVTVVAGVEVVGLEVPLVDGTVVAWPEVPVETPASPAGTLGAALAPHVTMLMKNRSPMTTSAIG